MEVQHGRRLTDNDRKHCWSNIDTAAVACLLGYFTSPAAPARFRSCHRSFTIAPRSKDFAFEESRLLYDPNREKRVWNGNPR